jgi:hypothetical protein
MANAPLPYTRLHVDIAEGGDLHNQRIENLKALFLLKHPPPSAHFSFHF